MLRVVATLPPGQNTYCYGSFELKVEKMIEQEMQTNKVSKRTARERTLGKIINDTEDGIVLKDLLALSGFETKFPLHCDNCTDEASCRVLRPYLSDGLSRCGHCSKHNDMCTFANLRPELLEEICEFPHFRAHAPCHKCWREGTLCSKDQGQCRHCEAVGATCQREMCSCFWDPRDDSFCVPDCDKTHYDDGYQNIVHQNRGDIDSNAQQTARQASRH